MSDKMELIKVLFRSRREVDIYPAIHGRMETPTPARRNRAGKGEVSKTITKAVLAALDGTAVQADTGTTVSGDRVVSVRTRGKTGSREAAIVYDRQWHIRGIYAPDGLTYIATYHIPLVALAEALVRPDAAGDLLDAYARLLAYYDALGHIPFEALSDDTTFRDLVLTASDELYFFLRYGDADPGPGNDRIGDSGEVRTGFSSEIGWQGDTAVDVAAFTNRAALDRATQNASGSPTAICQDPWPRVDGSFVGVQLGQLVHALQRGRNILAVGPTGSGKTHAISEAMAHLQIGYEQTKGTEGMLDLDFLGAIVPKEGGDRVWIDGPLARAFRRASSGRVAFWLDEATRVPTRMMNVLIGAMNPEGLGELALRGILPDGVSPSETFYTLEVPGTGEIISSPAENVVYVLSANVGRQYAVHRFDPALERRCHYQVDFDYLVEADERDLVAERIEQPPGAVIPTVVTRVAARVREQHINAELPGSLDTGSVVVWAQEAKEMVSRMLDVTIALVETARLTWIPRAVGRDHTGRADEGKALGMVDVIRDAAANASQGGQP